MLDSSKVYLALYKGKPESLFHYFTHIVTCVVLTIRDRSYTKYSHTELVINNTGYSSSVRDHGVRSKVIDFDSGKWDFIEVDINVNYALKKFNEKVGHSYDWAGALGWGLPLLHQSDNKEYCFEICAEMMNLDKPEKWTPLRFIKFFKKKE